MSPPDSTKGLADASQTTADIKSGQQSSSPQISPPRKRLRSNSGDGLLSSSKTRTTTHIATLRNLGNLCFTNAIIQVLLYTQPIREYFLNSSFPSTTTTSLLESAEETYRSPSPVGRPRTRQSRRLKVILPASDVDLSASFAALAQNLWAKNSVEAAPKSPTRSNVVYVSIISPLDFFNHCIAGLPELFADFAQQDAQEFLRCILDKIHLELLSKNKHSAESEPEEEDRSVIIDAFEGQLCSTVRCLSCTYTSYTFDPFLDLSLDLPIESLQLLTLEKLLQIFCGTETLGGIPTPPQSNTDTSSSSSTAEIEVFHQCTMCHAIGTSSKALQIGRCPEILCFHLKRFHWSMPPRRVVNGRPEDTRPKRRPAARALKQWKNDAEVQFPLHGLDMKPYMVEGDLNQIGLYNLYGVVVHLGKG